MSWIIRNQDLRHQQPEFLGSIFCVGNGRHCTRGTAGEARYDAYRGVFVSGLVTRAPMGLMYFSGAPDWLQAWIEIEGRRAECLDDDWQLDMRAGVVTRRATFSRGDTTVEVVEQRFASWADPSLAGQHLRVTRQAGQAAVSVVMGVDADIRQSRAKYYQPGEFPAVDETGLKLTEIESLTAANGTVEARLISPSTGRRSAAAAAIRVLEGAGEGEAFCDDGIGGVRFELTADRAAFEKLAAIVADLEGFESVEADLDRDFHRARSQTFAEASAAHRRAMEQFWDLADVRIKGDPVAQRAVRFAIWSTLHSSPLDGGRSSVGAKNLTGDWYRGAVFWDFDIFQLPLLAAVAPDRARNHELFRTRRLDGARRMARQDGYRGARYPGQSYEHGVEDPPCLGGLGRMEIHVTFEVAWGILHYAAITGDTDFLLTEGLETVLEITRFWASRIARDGDGSWHLRGICGPDELHKPVDDNAYMNHMIADLMRQATAALNRCRQNDPFAVDSLLHRMEIDDDERATWADIARNMHIPMLDDLVMEQFTDHSDLPIASPRACKDRGMGADRIGKQADTTLLFQNMPWAFSRDETLANYRMYAPLCNQTSSLSLCTHALVAGRLGLVRDAKRYFDMAAGVDLDDSMGNSDHGIHGAGEAGIWLAVVGGFGGLTVRPDGVGVSPHLPAGWQRLQYSFLLRGRRIEVDATPDGCRVTNQGPGEIALAVGGSQVSLDEGESVQRPVDADWREQGLDGVVFDEAAVLDDGSPTDEAITLVRMLSDAGVKTAIVAAGELDRDALTAAGFDAVVDATFLRKAKPDPQGPLVATQHLLALPWNCAGIAADSDAVDAMRRAGLAVVGIGSDAPQGRFDSISDLSPETLSAVLDEVDEPVNPYLERNIAIVQSEQKQKAGR